jgi:hypothetical protein
MKKYEVTGWWGRSERPRCKDKVWIQFDDVLDCTGAAQRMRLAATGRMEAEVLAGTVTEAEAEAWKPGQHVSLITGGAPGDSNPERRIEAEVLAVRRQPSDSIGQDTEIRVEIRTAETAYPWELYTWRGVLRHGSGAQPVRFAGE